MSELRDAVEALYFAAHWSPDRPVDEKSLWERVRDAAGIKPGQTAERLGPRRSAALERAVDMGLLRLEIDRLRDLNAELASIVLNDREGDLDFVQFQVREVVAKAGRA